MPENSSTITDEPPQPLPSDTSRDFASSIGFLYEWNSEIRRFYINRMKQYWFLQLRLHSCSTLEDFGKLQFEFQRDLIEAYRDEASSLSRIANKACKLLNVSMDTNYAENVLKAQQDAAEIIGQAKAQAERILASAHKRAGEQEEVPKVAKSRKSA